MGLWSRSAKQLCWACVVWGSIRKRVLANLTVLVRDFELDLVEGTSSSDGYLEQALAPEDVEDDTEECPEMQANRMKRVVKECFPIRHCYTLPHPTHGAGAGAKTTALGSDGGVTSDDFRRQVGAVARVSVGWRAWCPLPTTAAACPTQPRTFLRPYLFLVFHPQSIVASAPRKQLEGIELTGGMLCSVILDIVTALNTSAAVCIPDMWSSIVTRTAEAEARKVRFFKVTSPQKLKDASDFQKLYSGNTSEACLVRFVFVGRPWRCSTANRKCSDWRPAFLWLRWTSNAACKGPVTPPPRASPVVQQTSETLLPGSWQRLVPGNRRCGSAPIAMPQVLFAPSFWLTAPRSCVVPETLLAPLMTLLGLQGMSRSSGIRPRRVLLLTVV